MNTKFRERFLNNLTDTACAILKRYAQGEEITSKELIFLRTYMRELDSYEETPLSQKLLEGVKFVKDNFGSLLSAGTVAAVDDYEINTDFNVEDIDE